MERMITIRVQSKDGTKRLQAHPNQQLGDILGQVRPHNHLIIININIFNFLISLSDSFLVFSEGHSNHSPLQESWTQKRHHFCLRKHPTAQYTHTVSHVIVT